MGPWPMDRIDLFRVFVRVVESASFTRAAAMLGMPRSTVSAAVMALEQRLGVRLINRTTRRVSITQDGLAFYERCVNLLIEVEEAENLFRPEAAGPAGTIRVEMPGRIGRLVIAPALPAFLERFPDIDVHLGMTDRFVDLVAEGIDCALRVGTLASSGLIARHVGDLELINVASPAYLERFGTPDSPEDLSKHLAVNYVPSSTGRADDWEWVTGGTLHSMPLAGRVTVDNAEAYIACCLAGLGLIQIPAYDVGAHLASGELVEVMPDHRPQAMPMSLLYPSRRHLSRRLNIFADWLVATLHAHAIHRAAPIGL